MKNIYCAFLFTAMLTTLMGGMAGAKPKRTQINAYTDFLAGAKTNPVDYVMGLYDTYDVVIFCERDHRELTQYDFLLSLFKDERFINTVGNVFTEVGVANMTGEINRFLTYENLVPVQVKDSLLKIYRDMDFNPLWEKYNYYYLLEGLYNINKTLPLEKKIHYYPSDYPFLWDTCMTSESYKNFEYNMEKDRDSVMGRFIASHLIEIQKAKNRNKAFVILNYPHAFPKTTKSDQTSATQYIVEQYPGKIATIMINTATFDHQKNKYTCIHQGKWDAAFCKMGDAPVGFNLKGSPFGKDTFDFRRGYGKFTYEEMFTGFIFYIPLKGHKLTMGIPGIVDNSFLKELIRREKIVETKPRYLTRKSLVKTYGLLRQSKYKNLNGVCNHDP